jgi:L-threonylcarbamoyladenylate synthase
MSEISQDIDKAITILNKEELVAIPTETVYGLAGNIYSKKAVKAIFEIKQRPHFNPLIVHIPSITALSTIVSRIPEKAKHLAEAFWPGPLTMVLPKSNRIPDIVTGGKPTVAVRIPNHPLTLELLQKLDFPLAAPSANPFNRISPTTAQHVKSYFSNQITLILDGGPCERGIESTIIGFENDTPIVYRLGSIALEDIESVIGKVNLKTKAASAPSAPGMLERHYAPKTKMILTNSITAALKTQETKRVGLLLFHELDDNVQADFKIVLSTSQNLEEAAAALYDALHQLDQENLDIIIAERLPDYGLGRSINDRLERATKSE